MKSHSVTELLDEVDRRQPSSRSPRGYGGAAAQSNQLVHLLNETRRRLEASERKYQSIGLDMAGIAHDLNNLLTVILGNECFLLDALPADDVRRGDAEAVLEGAEHAAALIKLLTFCRIAKHVGGDMRIDSAIADRETAASQGSVMTADLPGLEPIATGTETILVVEDDRGVRSLVNRILVRLGYRVLEASSGEEAFAIVQSHEGPIDLVLSDIGMPDLSGAEIVSRLQSRSMVKALFMSGHTSHALLRDGVLDAGAHFIQKPFRPGTLARKVREVLSA